MTVRRHTDLMLTKAIWCTRTIGFSVVVLLTFLQRPTGPLAVPVQAVCCGLLALALVAWGLLDLHPVVGRHRAGWLPPVLAVVTVVCAFASTPGAAAAA
ncbi:hypothetical protein GXW82_07615 [Streptacidiphilus sp. 4-A2]|nr:hypothetical protein [Streptacidiphilus sp. 4-A2]